MCCGHHPLDDSALPVTLEPKAIESIISRMDPITAAYSLAPG